MKRSELVLLLAGLGLVGTTGCMEVSEKAQSGTRYVITGHPGGAYQPRNVNKYDLENSAKFVLLDKGVERSVTCPNIEERINDDGRMEVIANVRNRLNRRIEVQSSKSSDRPFAGVRSHRDIGYTGQGSHLPQAGDPARRRELMPHDIIDNRKEKLDTRVARAVRRDRGRRSQSDDQLARKSLPRTDHPGRESRGDVSGAKRCGR